MTVNELITLLENTRDREDARGRGDMDVVFLGRDESMHLVVSVSIQRLSASETADFKDDYDRNPTDFVAIFNQ